MKYCFLRLNARFLFALAFLGISCTAPSKSTPECTSSEAQNGTTVCGLNNEGVLVQTCTDGLWVDSTDCTGKDACHNGDAESHQCGFNEAGTQTRRCSEGTWEEWDECEDLDICTNDTEDSQSCGYNSNGTQNRDCNQGQWEIWGECNDPDECENTQSQMGTTPCGLNNAGTFQQTCIDGQWADNLSQCEDPDSCVNGTQESEACGMNNNGTQSRSCYEGNWTHFNTCTDTDICINDSTDTTACGINSAGTSTRICADGGWGAFECVDPDVCLNGLSQNGTTSCGDGFIGVYRQDCTEGQWVDDTEDCSGVCVDLDNAEDADLQFYPWSDSDTTIVSKECPDNMVVVGIRGYAGSWIDQITLLCQTLHPTGYITGDLQALSPVGSSTGGSESDNYTCPEDKVMVGAQAGDKLNYISCVQPHCADVEYIAAFDSASQYSSAETFGQAGDCSDAAVGNALCPDGHVVTGVVGRQHYTYAGSLQWKCRPLKNCGQ